jgi:hypothetical protein
MSKHELIAGIVILVALGLIIREAIRVWRG